MSSFLNAALKSRCAAALSRYLVQMNLAVWPSQQNSFWRWMLSKTGNSSLTTLFSRVCLVLPADSVCSLSNQAVLWVSSGEVLVAQSNTSDHFWPFSDENKCYRENVTAQRLLFQSSRHLMGISSTALQWAVHLPYKKTMTKV